MKEIQIKFRRVVETVLWVREDAYESDLDDQGIIDLEKEIMADDPDYPYGDENEIFSNEITVEILGRREKGK